LLAMPNACWSELRHGSGTPPPPCDFSTQMIVGEPYACCQEVQVKYTKICYYSDHIDLTRESDYPTATIVAHCNVACSLPLAYAVPLSTLPIRYIDVRGTY